MEPSRARSGKKDATRCGISMPTIRCYITPRSRIGLCAQPTLSYRRVDGGLERGELLTWVDDNGLHITKPNDRFRAKNSEHKQACKKGTKDSSIMCEPRVAGLLAC